MIIDYYGARRIATTMARIIHSGQIKYFDQWMNFNTILNTENPFYIDAYRHIDTDTDGLLGRIDFVTILKHVKRNYTDWKGFENIFDLIPEIFRRYDINNTQLLNFNG